MPSQIFEAAEWRKFSELVSILIFMSISAEDTASHTHTVQGEEGCLGPFPNCWKVSSSPKPKLIMQVKENQISHSNDSF